MDITILGTDGFSLHLPSVRTLPRNVAADARDRIEFRPSVPRVMTSPFVTVTYQMGKPDPETAYDIPPEQAPKVIASVIALWAAEEKRHRSGVNPEAPKRHVPTLDEMTAQAMGASASEMTGRWIDVVVPFANVLSTVYVYRGAEPPTRWVSDGNGQWVEQPSEE